MSSERSFRRELLPSLTAPFIAVALLPMLILCFRQGIDGPQMLLAAGLLVLLIVAVFTVPWARLPFWTTAIVPLAYLLVVALMRGSEGEATVTSGALVLIPVVWFALYGSRRELVIAMAGAVAVFVVPALLSSKGVSYSVDELNKALVFGLVVILVGFTVHGLVEKNTALITKLDLDAHRDHLTGLPNRLAWVDDVEAALATSASNGEPLSVAMIDLDGLKEINDRDGHAAGDDALLSASRAWAATLPETATLARLGGDEFALLLPGMTRGAATASVEAIRRSTGDTLPCSIGLIRCRPHESGSAILKRADLALYVAKNAGGNRISEDAGAVRGCSPPPA